MSGQIVKRKINSFENENFTTIKFGYYTYKTNDKVDWKISNETKKFRITHYRKQQPDLVAETGQRGFARTFRLMKVHLNFGAYRD